MRFRLLITLAALVALPASSAAAASEHTVLKLRSCQAGNTAAERQAVFYARMHAVPGTERMQIRFSLLRRLGKRSSVVVKAPMLSEWRRSRAGVESFGYEQTVTGLGPRGTYAVSVQFRWIGADGKAIKTLRRTSSWCRQAGAVANLAVTGVKAKQGDAPGTAVYSVEVTNRGNAVARDVVVDLFVDGAATDARQIDVLKPGQTVAAEFSGPVCEDEVRAEVDRGGTSAESTKSDNTLILSCPMAGS